MVHLGVWASHMRGECTDESEVVFTDKLQPDRHHTLHSTACRSNRHYKTIPYLSCNFGLVYTC
jgi:hypothetical protein